MSFVERVLTRLFDAEELPFGRRWRIAGNYSSPDTKQTGWLRLPWLKNCGVYIHRIDKPDLDRHCHSHPYNFGSFVLSGGQCQGVLTPDGVKNEWLRPLQFYHMPKERYHRVQYLPGSVCWTLFLAGPAQWTTLADGRKVHAWFFNVDGKPVLWTKYREMFGNEQ